ncbi:MAG: oligosaccharide flippase family protein [bacterium]|nr:oligosaccharide flippase family protein [bacterium]
MQKQSFAKGAVILMAANAVSKLLGAGFKIPLTYILREEGMAVYNTAFTVYIMFLAFVVSGIPTAVSKAVAQSDERSAFRITDTAEKVLLVIGTAASAVLYFGAPFFALAMKEENAVLAIRLVSPSILLVALGTGCKSFFHGASSMNIPAASQVAEAAVKLAAGYILAVLMLGMGRAAAAAGAIAGVTAGEFIATGILAAGYLAARRKTTVKATRAERRESLKELLSVAVPLLLAEAALNAVSVTDTSVLRTRMLVSGLSPEEARFLYGAFSGYAMTVFNLPVGILGTIGISLLPAAASAVADGCMEKARSPLCKGVELTMFISIPAAVLIWLLPGEILNILFRNTSSALMLKYMAPCIITVSLVQLLSAVIQACGKVVLPSITEIFGLLIKIAVMWQLCAMPQLNIYGTVIGSNIAYLIIVIADVIALKKITGLKLGIVRGLIKPCIASAAMAAAVIYAMRYCGGSAVQVIAVCGAGGAVYIIVYAVLYRISAALFPKKK